MLILKCSQGCEHSRINILQWILIKLGTYLVHRRIWNPIDFQGHSRINILQWILTKLYTKFGQNPLKDVDSRVTLKINRAPDSPKD
jgi:hypothetical protein